MSSLKSHENKSEPGQPEVFVLEQNLPLLKYMDNILRNRYAVRMFSDQAEFLTEIENGNAPDVALLPWISKDQSMGLVSQVIASKAVVILSTSSSDVNDIGQIAAAGVREIVRRPFSALELHEAIDRQIAEIVTPDTKNEVVVTPLGDNTSFVRSGKRMRDIETQARLVARSDIPVLILGESGTGKEVLAKYTHAMSFRSDKIFLKVNCAAMPADLLESELFGYEQGAFTGALKTKPGKFEIANGGTIFLDEIGEMPAILQAKLLHVLQDGTFSRLGSRAPMKADVRVVAATNIDMKAAMAAKTFREDLYYRLNGFSFTLPPLRERPEEIPTFTNFFMQKGSDKYGRDPLPISSALMAALTRYTWPGNLRELENVMNRYLIIGDEESILADIVTRTPTAAPTNGVADTNGDVGLKQLVKSLKGDAEASAIALALEETKWNRKAAAHKMQISYKALLYKIKQYDLARR